MDQDQPKLNFNATWSMAVGGMVGGGLFSILGVVVGIAGVWTWLSFLVAGPLNCKNRKGIPDRAVISLGVLAAVLAVFGTLTTLVEAASLAFLFTFAVVCGLAFRERAGLRSVTGFGTLTATAASIALIARLVRTDPMALVFLVLLVLFAVLGRPILLHRLNSQRRQT